ncbi:MAG: sulfite exporter TauE/SafE family protein [Clostridia bacterium]|nr:sulfite exporter TauE/SafE family protein [Clostridia bacterium]
MLLVLIIGLATGILSGLAVGGGTLLVPALVLFLGVGQHMAQGVSLAAFIPTALVAVITHYRHGNVRLDIAVAAVTGSVLGAVAGSLMAAEISADLLKKVFGVFLIIMGVYEFTLKDRVKI